VLLYTTNQVLYLSMLVTLTNTLLVPHPISLSTPRKQYGRSKTIGCDSNARVAERGAKHQTGTRHEAFRFRMGLLLAELSYHLG
jgi:hypothetical protein